MIEDAEIELHDPPATLTIPRYEPYPEGVKKLNELPPVPVEKQKERMAYFRKIVAEHQYQPVRWYDKSGKKRQLTVDGTTAAVVCQAIDQLSDTNRALVLNFEPPKLIDFIWKLVGKTK